jgi:hypothetical protein
MLPSALAIYKVLQVLTRTKAKKRIKKEKKTKKKRMLPLFFQKIQFQIGV